MTEYFIILNQQNKPDHSKISNYHYGLNIAKYNHKYEIINSKFLDFDAEAHWICLIELPINDANFEISQAALPNSYITNQIIIIKNYYLFDPITINKFNLILGGYGIKRLCELGDLNTLKKWYELGWINNYDESLLDLVSYQGHQHILNWLMGLELKLEYSYMAIDNASYLGHVKVLEWWKNSGLELKYTEAAIDNLESSRNGINVLNWWVNSGLKLKYTDSAIYYASKYNDLDILKWWFGSGLNLLYTEDSIDSAVFAENIDILDAWFESGLPLKYSKPDFYSTEPNIINWWLKSGLEYSSPNFDKIGSCINTWCQIRDNDL